MTPLHPVPLGIARSDRTPRLAAALLATFLAVAVLAVTGLPLAPGRSAAPVAQRAATASDAASPAVVQARATAPRASVSADAKVASLDAPAGSSSGGKAVPGTASAAMPELGVVVGGPTVSPAGRTPGGTASQTRRGRAPPPYGRA